MKECNQNTLGDSKPSKALLIQWESEATTNCSKTLKSKMGWKQEAKSKRDGEKFQ
jgi:hypothetical protein